MTPAPLRYDNRQTLSISNRLHKIYIPIYLTRKLFPFSFDFLLFKFYYSNLNTKLSCSETVCIQNSECLGRCMWRRYTSEWNIVLLPLCNEISADRCNLCGAIQKISDIDAIFCCFSDRIHLYELTLTKPKTEFANRKPNVVLILLCKENCSRYRDKISSGTMWLGTRSDRWLILLNIPFVAFPAVLLLQVKTKTSKFINNNKNC